MSNKFDIDKISKYVNQHDSVPCYKNGEITYLGDAVELTLQMTNKCNACCTFCSNSQFKDYDFDFDKFKDMLSAIKDNYCIIKVAITGGEPTLHPLFVDVVHYIREQLSNAEIVINTNGSDLNKLADVRDCNPEYGISRHHYMNDINQKIFHSFKVPTFYDISDFIASYDANVLLHCNLINGYIDSLSKCIRFLDTSIIYGIKRVGFVELMPYTEDAIKDKVNVKLIDLPNTVITRMASRNGFCHCINMRYMDKIDIYNKSIDCNNCALMPNQPFVYNHNMLRHGFSGEIIW